MEAIDDAGREQVDEQLSAWRQGDCVIGEHWFLFRTNTEDPLTRDAVVAVKEGAENAEAAVRGFAVLTQTCDLVRHCVDRPFVEVSPLVEVADRVLREVERGRRSNYVLIPGVARHRLVADLDRVMTIEKTVVAVWERTEGCRTHDDARRLSLALARKRARTAFPDDFEDDPGLETTGWEHYLTALPRARPQSGRFVRVDGVVQTLDDLTARTTSRATRSIWITFRGGSRRLSRFVPVGDPGRRGIVGASQGASRWGRGRFRRCRAGSGRPSLMSR